MAAAKKTEPEPELDEPTPEQRVSKAKRALTGKLRSVETARRNLVAAENDVEAAGVELRAALGAYHLSELEALGLDPTLDLGSRDEVTEAEQAIEEGSSDDDDFYDPEAQV